MTAEIGKDIQKAAELIRRGEVVAFPTETVYGLGGNALQPETVARIFEIKNRPTFDPLIVHIGDERWLQYLVREIPDTVRELMSRFWPGPLTLILPKQDIVPDLVTAGLPAVGIRMPDHPLALDLLKQVDLPIAAPSANPFSQISPTCAQHVADQLGEVIPYILDGGNCRVGVESTVVSVIERTVWVLRPGGISHEKLQEAGFEVKSTETNSQEGTALPAPGLLSKHYAPHTPLQITENPSARPGKQIGLLAFRSNEKWGPESFSAVELLSPEGNLREAATNFFAALRRLDQRGLDLILATPFPNRDLGVALNNRLQRAAHQ